MSRRHIRWLHGQLPLLVAQNVLSAETAARLKAHYDSRLASSTRSLALTLFAILGGTLIAGGIILLVAHNWPQFGRPTRAVLALALVLLGQAAAGFTLWRGKTGAAYCEGTGLFAQLTFGAGFALIAQTYHLSDDLGSFILTWMLATLPLVYLLRATGPALIYLAGITSWAGTMNSWQHHGNPTLWWLWLALLLPYAVATMRRHPYHPRAILLMWGLAIAGTVGTFICLDSGWRNLWLVIYSGLYVSMYLAGAFWQGEGTSLWQRPLTFIGGAGAAILAFIMTFSDTWDHMGWRDGDHSWPPQAWATLHDFTLAAVATVGAVILMVTCRRRGQVFRLGLGVLPVLAALGYALVTLSGKDLVEGTCFLVANIYFLALGVMVLCEGLQKQQLANVNAGMLALAVLFVARFFNSDFGFVTKGIAFIVIGAGFLAVNVGIARRKGGRT